MMNRQWPQSYRLFVKCVRGLEGALERELISFGFHQNSLIKSRSGITIEEASLRKLYFLSYFSRLSSGVFVEAKRFRLKDKLSFIDSCAEVDWRHFMKLDASYIVNSCLKDRSSFLQSQPYASKLVKDGLSHFFRKHVGQQPPTVSFRDPSVTLQVNIDHGEVQLLVDGLGAKAATRGYRYKPALDGINPTVAVALLHDMGFTSYNDNPVNCTYYEGLCNGEQDDNEDGACIDLQRQPACWDGTRTHIAKEGAVINLFSGCGTFLIEAAMIAARIAPGTLFSSFGFQEFPLYDKDSFDKLVDYASAIRVSRDSEAYEAMKGRFIGIEPNWEKVEACLYSAEKAGVLDMLRITRSEYLKDGIYDSYRSRTKSERWSFLIAQLPRLNTRFITIPDTPDGSKSKDATVAKTKGKLHQLDPTRYYRLAGNIGKFRKRLFDPDVTSLLVAPTVVNLEPLSEAFGCELKGGKHFMSNGIPCTVYHSRKINV